MRHILMITLVAFLLTACSGGGDKKTVTSRSEQELLSSYLAYHQKKDLDGILSLFYRQDTPPFVIDSVKKRTQKNFDYTIASAKIEEISPEKLKTVMAGLPFNGKTLIPNLTPTKQISIRYEQTGQSGENGEMRAAGATIMLGRIDNVCYFVLSKVQESGTKIDLDAK